MTAEQPQGGAALGVGTNIVPGPDGKQAVVLQLQVGPLIAQLGPVVPEQARALGNMIKASMDQAADEASRRNLGIVIPQNGHAAGMPMPRGLPQLPRGLPPLPGASG